MPELTIEYHQQCAAGVHYNINGYGVSIEYGFESCTCPDYQFRKKKQGKFCKHIIAAQKQYCGWHGAYFESQTEEQRKNYICPCCGGPTEIVKVGV